MATEYIHEIPSEEDLKYFGSTALIESVGLAPECVYDRFVLFVEKENFLRDLDSARVFSSKEYTIE